MDKTKGFQHGGQNDERTKGQVALKAFFQITKKWHCSEQDRLQLLGGIDSETLAKYQELPLIKLDKDVLERISLIMGIYKALQSLYSTPELADARIRRATSDRPFCGLSAMDYMTKGHSDRLLETRRYFDAQITN